MALSICGFAGGYSRAVFLRPGVALRYTPGCVLAPFQGAGGGDDWMMWGWGGGARALRARRLSARRGGSGVLPCGQ